MTNQKNEHGNNISIGAHGANQVNTRGNNISISGNGNVISGQSLPTSIPAKFSKGDTVIYGGHEATVIDYRRLGIKHAYVIEWKEDGSSRGRTIQGVAFEDDLKLFTRHDQHLPALAADVRALLTAPEDDNTHALLHAALLRYFHENERQRGGE